MIKVTTTNYCFLRFNNKREGTNAGLTSVTSICSYIFSCNKKNIEKSDSPTVLLILRLLSNTLRRSKQAFISLIEYILCSYRWEVLFCSINISYINRQQYQFSYWVRTICFFLYSIIILINGTFRFYKIFV